MIRFRVEHHSHLSMMDLTFAPYIWPPFISATQLFSYLPQWCVIKLFNSHSCASCKPYFCVFLVVDLKLTSASINQEMLMFGIPRHQPSGIMMDYLHLDR